MSGFLVRTGGTYAHTPGTPFKVPAGGAYGFRFGVRAGGAYRIENASLAGYVAWVGYGAAPLLSGLPSATSATLPMAFPVVPPATGTTTLHIVVRRRNRYGLLSQNQAETLVVINTDGTKVLGPVTAPDFILINIIADERFLLTVVYNGLTRDAHPATLMKVFLGAGAAPDVGVDAPVAQRAITDNEMSFVLGPYTTGGTTYHVAVVVVREVDNETSTPATAQLIVPVDPVTPVPVLSGYAL